MRQHRKFIAKIICFSLGAILLVSIVTMMLVPKYLYNNQWPSTQTSTDFYDMEENTVDVLFFGSSHCINAFSPMELYETYGIRSYNLGSEEQNLLITYYWLREALRYQSPKVVVLDIYFLFPYFDNDYPLNSSEASQRKALDYMRWSSNKREAVHTICEIDESQSELSYYLPNIRYHERWQDLNEDDFTYDLTPAHSALMGYSALSDNCTYFTTYSTYSASQSAEPDDPYPIMQEYLDKIVQLCNEEQIQLILVNTPHYVSDLNKYIYVQQYANDNGLQYIDFNEKSVYESIQYDFQTNNSDPVHANYWGSVKLTDYIGNILTTEYGVQPAENSKYEELISYYEEIKKDCNLTKITDIYEYLDAINDDRYAVFISVNDEATASLDDRLRQELADLGAKVDLTDKTRYSYYAVLNGDKPNESLAIEELSSNGTLRNGKTMYTISSAGYDAGSSSSIEIDGEEYSVNQRGLNVVVYSLDSKKVIDSVCFDTYDENLGATRQ